MRNNRGVKNFSGSAGRILLLLLLLWLSLFCGGAFGQQAASEEGHRAAAKAPPPPTTATTTTTSAPPPQQQQQQQQRPDYIIVGAGGSGLQTALLLQKHNLSYVVLERDPNRVGTFWLQFPRFRELISVNKAHLQNQTQRWRYDWHSFLEAPLQMSNVTDAYFPQGQHWQEYMARVSELAQLHIEFNVTVERLSRGSPPCVYLAGGKQRCARKRVFVGTGLREKQEPFLRALGGIPYSQITRDHARGKRVCVLGNGNSGFEVAQNLYPVADRVILTGKHPFRLSSITRYAGNVRVKVAQVLENVLDAVDHLAHPPRRRVFDPFLNEFNRTHSFFVNNAGAHVSISPSQVDKAASLLPVLTWLNYYECETFVISTGFESSVPGMSLGGGSGGGGGGSGNGEQQQPQRLRFPPTTDRWYAWTENPSVHFVGYLMHEADFQHGSGGFLHGYRYLIRNLIHHVISEDSSPEEQQRQPYPHDVLTKNEVIQRAVARCQIADDLVLMTDGVVLRDVVVPVPTSLDEDPHQDNQLYRYCEGVTYNFHDEFNVTDDGVVSLYFAWGDSRKASRVFDDNSRFHDTLDPINANLHPVVEAQGLVRDIQEDPHFEWTHWTYVASISKAVRAALDGKVATFFPKPTYSYERAVTNQGGAPRKYDSAGKVPRIGSALIRALLSAAQSDGAPADLARVSRSAASWLPGLFDGKGGATARVQ